MLDRTWTLSVVALTLPFVLSVGCRKNADDALAFEPAPRPVIAQSGISPSRNAQVGVTNVSSVSVHMLALLGEGNLTRVALLNSEDGGDTFGQPVWASEPGGDVTSGGENSPAFVVTPGPMYAAWSEGQELRFARSMTWGGSFEKPIPLNEKTAFAGYPSLGVAPNGDVYAVWIDGRDQQGDGYSYSIYLARSTDKGANFGKNVRVASGICPCCRPTLNFGPQGEVMVFWRHVYPGSIRDMTVAVSLDS
ncbi:MAG TPA: sialidase family protein, partial [Terriglobales bacterium]|nr:sialidase family protein [Terriglobales bacterium]